MASSQPYFDPEEIGRRRLPDNKNYRADLNSQSSAIQNAMSDLIASNYPKSNNSNLSIFNRTLAREIVRQQDSMNFINTDKIFTQTRIKYLQQILGERLFLQEQLAPFTQDDVGYRKFLIAIKDAFLKGSTKAVIENIIDQFTDLEVNVKELYLESRDPKSAYTLVDTHKMIIELFIDDLASGQSIADINNNLAFFVNLVKPAHVLYDTKLIWTEIIQGNKIHDIYFGDTGGGCVPKYIWTPFNEKVVLATQIRVVSPDFSGPNTYTIGSIQTEKLIIYLTNDTKVIVEPGTDGTQIYGISGRRILFTDLLIGQTIQLISQAIPGDFNFYYLPPDLVEDYDSRFYKNVYRKGAFQEFVKKEMDSRGRFPLQIASSPTTICDRWVHDVLQPLYEDMRKDCNLRTETSSTYDVVLKEHMWSPRFTAEGVDTTNERPLVGDLLSFTMPYAPLTDSSQNPAGPSDITVLKNGAGIINSVYSVDASTAYISLTNSPSYWDSTNNWDSTALDGTAIKSPIIGDILRFDYNYLADSTVYPASTEYVYGINYWQLPGAPISNGQGTNFLALPSDVGLSVDGTAIPDAVIDLEAVNGLVTVQAQKDFWVASPLGRAPSPGDIFQFSYYKSGASKYAMLFDDPFRLFDDDMVFDGEGQTDPARTPIAYENPLQIGYKFRADLLHHASVLNSSDSLLLNNYQKPAKRASIANRQDTLNHFNYFFSPEFLTDTATDIVLNDAYLDSDVPPAITLNAGTPTFQQTYAYQPGMIREKKLTDIRTNHSLLMYCDLLLKEYRSGSSEVHLSSICDNDSPKFSIRFKEDLDGLTECEDWILFDTGDTTQVQMSIPSDVTPAINLRVLGQELRDNFILRDMSSTGTTSINYTFQENDSSQNSFQLPDTTRVSIDGTMVDFPALPVMHDATTLATASDVIVRVDGVVTPGLIQTFDPVTGYIDFYPQSSLLIVEYITVTQQNIDQQYLRLDKPPINPESVLVSVEHGPAQAYGIDYDVSENIIFLEMPFRSLLAPGDVLVVTYDAAALENREIKFTYKIQSTGLVSIIDLNQSRVFDSDDVFPYYCYDGYKKEVSVKYTEYINFLDDYSKGIKFVYLNKDTLQLEEHIFSGPVFETYEASKDEISAIESFPNAGVRVVNPLSQADPLRILSNYDFLNDAAVRIRKKTIRELLPDRTFRTLNVHEVLPV